MVDLKSTNHDSEMLAGVVCWIGTYGDDHGNKQLNCSNPKQKTDVRAAVKQARDRKLCPGARVAGWSNQQRSDRNLARALRGGLVCGTTLARCGGGAPSRGYVGGIMRLTGATLPSLTGFAKGIVTEWTRQPLLLRLAR